MRKIISSFVALLFTYAFFTNAPSSLAADIRTNQDITIPATTENLEDIYLFGGNIRVEAPVTNDLVAAGGDITISDVTGDVLATGGNLNLRGTIGNNVRIAGGNILIDGPVERDLVVTGGTVTVTENASISGDVLFAGGNLNLQAPVGGKVLVGGGHVAINNTVGGNVEGNVDELVLGPAAVINGNLSYRSPQKASLASGAVVRGKQTFSEEKERKNTDAGGIFAGAALYKLIADIILSVLFIFFFGRFTRPLFARMTKSPVQSGAIGFAFFFLTPILSFLFLILIWLGVASFLFYGLAILFSIFLTKVFIGWGLLTWWEKRQNKAYTLDWKAGVVGPIILFIVLLIPVIGWFAAAILFFVALGSVTQQIASLLSEKKVTAATVTSEPALTSKPVAKPTTRPAAKKKK